MNLILSLIVIGITTIQCIRIDNKISNVRLCQSLKENVCTSDRPSFSTSIPLVYCSFQIINPNEETELEISWYYLGDSRVLIKETSLIIPEGKSEINMYSSIEKPLNGWPKGIYEVKVSLGNGKSESVIKSFLMN